MCFSSWTQISHSCSPWQAPHHIGVETNISGIRSNVHVFHWQVTEEARVRLPLDDGQIVWLPYLREFMASDRDRYALLEFVKADKAEQFLQDAATLKRWLSQVTT